MGEPPHWLVKYAKWHVFNAIEADFLWKIENSPPIGKQPPQMFEFWISAEKSVSISAKIFLFLFYFGDHLFLGVKNVWNSDFGRKSSLKIGESFFFFF